MATAKVFWTGRSQAVRLPLEFRFDADEVEIRREGDRVILEPVKAGWDWLADVTGPLDPDFADAATERLPMQDRPGLVDAFE